MNAADIEFDPFIVACRCNNKIRIRIGCTRNCDAACLLVESDITRNRFVEGQIAHTDGVSCTERSDVYRDCGCAGHSDRPLTGGRQRQDGHALCGPLFRRAAEKGNLCLGDFVVDRAKNHPNTPALTINEVGGVPIGRTTQGGFGGRKKDGREMVDAAYEGVLVTKWALLLFEAWCGRGQIHGL